MADIFNFYVYEFPSPFGVLILSTRAVALRTARAEEISVPFRGSFSFYYHMNANEFRAFLFPSPFGVLFLSTWFNRCSKEGFRFPSPFGVLFFSTLFFAILSISDYAFPSPFGVLFLSTLASAARINTGLQRPFAAENLFRYIFATSIQQKCLKTLCFPHAEQNQSVRLILFIQHAPI